MHIGGTTQFCSFTVPTARESSRFACWKANADGEAGKIKPILEFGPAPLRTIWRIWKGILQFITPECKIYRLLATRVTQRCFIHVALAHVIQVVGEGLVHPDFISERDIVCYREMNAAAKGN